MAQRDRAAEAETAARYRTGAELFRSEARAARSEGREADAVALAQTAGDLTVLASSIERDVRGLPPLPPAALPTEPKGPPA